MPSIVAGRDPFSFERVSGASVPAGRRARSPHEFIGVSHETVRLDLCSPALRVRLRGRVRSDDFCKRVLRRARLWTTRTSHIPGEGRGRLPATEGCPSSRFNRRRFSGSGVEGFRTSTLPGEIALTGDFAPAPIASGSSRRERRSHSLSGTTWGESLAAITAPACMAGAAKRVAMRPPSAKKDGRTLTRGAFHREAARVASSGSPSGGRSHLSSSLRLFHRTEGLCEGRSPRFCQLGPRRS